MELLSLDSSDLFFIFVAFIAFIAFLKSLKSPIITIAQGRVPPGPPKLPVIGNLHQLKSPPHRSLAELASKHGPIMRLQLGQLTTTVISSADLARDILTTHDVTFANRPITAGNRILSYGLLDIGFAPYGPYWRQLRKICKSDLLSSGRVGSFRKIREDEAAKLVREIAEEAQGNEGVNLSKKLSGMTYGIALSSAFGRNCKAREDYIAIVHRIFKMMTGFTLVNLFPGVKLLERATGMKPKLMKLHGEKDGIVQRILKKNIRGDGNEEDLTDVLLRFQEPGDLVFPLTHDSIKANLWVLTALLCLLLLLGKILSDVMIFKNKHEIDITYHLCLRLGLSIKSENRETDRKPTEFGGFYPILTGDCRFSGSPLPVIAGYRAGLVLNESGPL
ncbi:Costunolide synthase [Linum grandiflorum]